MKIYVDKNALQDYTTKLIAKEKTIFASKTDVGTPLVASTVAGMTDHDKIYVYVGSETGYTSGNWYYWDGSAWVSGGIYNSEGFVLDDTLTSATLPAQAKAVGDKVSQLSEEINNGFTNQLSTDDMVNGTWSGRVIQTNSKRVTIKNLIPVSVGDKLVISNNNDGLYYSYGVYVGSDPGSSGYSGWITASGATYDIQYNGLFFVQFATGATLDASQDITPSDITLTVGIVSTKIKIDTLETKIDNASESIDDIVNGFDIVWNDGKALTTAGTLVTLSGYSASDMIPITETVKNSTFKNIRQRISYTIVPLCFYKLDGTFIGYYTYPDAGNDAPITVKISDVLPNYTDAEFIRVGKSSADTVTVDSYTIKSLAEQIDKVGHIYPPYNITAYPKILCCGDSVTYGYVVEGTQSDPGQIYESMPEQSYPSCLGRIYGNEITTVAQAGISIKSFYETKYPTITFTDYNMVLFELGLNPGDEGYLNYNDFDNPGTSTYIYRQMIAGVRASAPDITIVLLRSPSHSNNWPAVLNAIAEESDCVVVDLADTKYINLNDTKYHGWYNNGGSAAFDDTHFTRIGYAAKAYDIAAWLGELLPY